MNKKWTHKELIVDLAKHFNDLNTIVLTERPAGSIWHQDEVPIPDLMVMNKSYKSMDFKICEVKASKEDFRQDIVSQKWTKYLPFCDKFYFAIPDYLEWKELVAPHTQIGILRRNDKGWRQVRRSNKEPRKTQGEMFWQALLFSATREMFFLRGKETELEKNERYLKQLKDSVDGIAHYGRLLDEKLEQKRREVEARELEVKSRERNIEAEIVSNIKKALGASGWRDTLRGMLKEDVLRPAEIEMAKRFNAIVEIILGENAQH